MKLSKKIILSFFISTIFSFSSVFAAWIDHFQVDLSPKTANVNDAVDLTIEAVDKNNNVIKDYDWTILIFSESDPEAELPISLEDNTYTYKLSDEWVVKFENAVKFKNAWTQNINVYDLNDDTVFWIAEIQINEPKSDEKIDIEISSPEDWLTIWENKINVSWTTQKNHQVKVIINGKNELKTTSNSDWIYEIEATDLVDWDNTIKAQVLNADWNVVWESNEIKIKVNTDSLSIKNVKVTPESVDPENSFEIQVIANPKLNKVEAILNDVVTKLEETKEWVYTAKLYAPKESGTYKIDIKISDELWHEKTEVWSSSIKVNEIKLEAAKEEPKKEEVKKETNTWTTTTNKKDLKITWLKLVELKTKSILSWNPVEWAESYNIYKKSNNNNNWELELITNTKKTSFEIVMWNQKETYDYFAVKAVAKTNSWEIYEGSLSDATKVKTWPEILILFLLSLFIGWLILVVKQKKA